MGYRAKRELLVQIAPRYREASSALKEVILDEFVAATGYARKYAIRLLNHPVDLKLAIERPRPPRYGLEVQQALHLTWTTANHICAKRLVPFLPTLVESLERHGHLQLSEESRNLLLSMSAATADRMLRPYRGIASEPDVGEITRMHYVQHLARGVMREMGELGRKGYLITKIYSTSDTPTGIATAIHIGMQEYGPKIGKRLRFVLDVSTSSSFLLDDYKQGLAKWKKEQQASTKQKRDKAPNAR
jgi:hypothetical protein